MVHIHKHCYMQHIYYSFTKYTLQVVFYVLLFAYLLVWSKASLMHL